MRPLLHRPTVDPADVIAAEWTNLSTFRRLIVRLVAPDTAKASRYLSQHPRHVAQVPYAGMTREERPRGILSPTPATDLADRWFAGSSR